MSKYEYLSNTQLHEALKTYLAFLESRGLPSRTEEIRVSGALGRMQRLLAACRGAGIPVIFHNETFRPGHPELRVARPRSSGERASCAR